MEASRAALASARASLPATPPALDTSAYYPSCEAARALVGDGLDGVCCAKDNRVLIAAETVFPEGGAESVAWWFSDGCKGDAEYRLWHPEDHVEGRWTDGWYEKQPADVANETHLVTEHLGKRAGRKASKYRIQFAPSSTYGIGANEMAAARCDVCVAARVATHDAVLGWLDVGHFVHFTLPREDEAGGFRLLSRFWLFDVDVARGSGLGFMSSVVRAVANTTPVRSVAARAIGGGSPEALGMALWTHASEEFRVLASFLPALHADRDQRREVCITT